MFSTPSYRTDVDMLASLVSEAYRIGGYDAVNILLLKYIAKLGKLVFLLIGMCTLEEVQVSVNLLRRGLGPLL